MASSGSFKTGNYEGRYLVFAWEVSSQSTENNKTKISWSLKGAGEASAGWYYAQNIKAIIAGETVFNDYTNPSGGDQLKLYNGTTVATGTYTFTHDSNGEKSFSASVEAGIYNWAVNCKGSDSWDLPTIARASTLTSAANVTLGNACSVKWTPKSTSFWYKLKFSMGDWSYTTGAIHPETTSAYTYTGYTIPLEAAKQIPSKTSGSMTVALYTYSDSGCKKQVGDASSKTFTVTVPNNSSTKPSISIDNLSPVSSLGSAFDGLYVQGKSKVKAEFTGSGKYGATISKYTMTVDGKSYGSSQNYTSNYLSNYGQFAVKISVEDSRGFTNSATKNITVIPYSIPKVDALICQRCDADGNLDDSGTYLKIKATRNYSKVMSGDVQSNYCLIRYRYKAQSATSYSTWTPILEKTDLSSDTVETDALLSGSLNAKTSYIVQIGVLDDVGGSAYVSTNVSTESVYCHRDGARKSYAFGGYVEDDNTFSTAEDITFKAKGPVVFTAEKWVSLGLSSNVSESGSNMGRGPSGTGCWYRVMSGGTHIQVAFNCAFTFSGSRIQVNLDAIPEAYRPPRNAYSFCALGGRYIARVFVTNTGNIHVEWVQSLTAAESTTSATVSWIDGYIDYWI